jgi:hypothetical protein
VTYYTEKNKLAGLKPNGAEGNSQAQSQQGQNGMQMKTDGRPFQLQLPVPAIETEADRRKRKLREYLVEQAPGVEYEAGASEVGSAGDTAAECVC